MDPSFAQRPPNRLDKRVEAAKIHIRVIDPAEIL